MSETKKMVEDVDVCISCGNVFVDADDYDTLGSKGGRCCPDCGTEKFVSVQTIIKQRDDLLELCKGFVKGHESGAAMPLSWLIKKAQAAIAKCEA